MQGHEVESRRVGVLGAGGAGAAIALALAQAGVAELNLDDIDMGKCDRLASAIRSRFPQARVAIGPLTDAESDVAVNATPLGMHPTDALPFDPEKLSRHALVVDIVTKPEMTPLLLRAQATGRSIHTGRHMHLGQATLVAEFFRARDT
jgi:shikimate dehydrogenase